MDKKIFTILLIGIFCISFASAHWYDPFHWFHSEPPVDSQTIGNMDNQIGYEIYGDTVYMWNTQDNYFFEKDSGIQLTNHYEDYWTKNVFCLGYYNNDEWNKIKCSDELTGFNRDIETDNLTYVNATLWKDINYQGYDIRFGVQYHLGLNDENLSVKIYVKNIGVDIPFDLGFGWKIKDWEIPGNQVGGDSILINDTMYDLDGIFDLTFENMNESFLRGNDYTEFLRIDWDNNLDYKVKMFGDGNQENFHVSILINGGHFNPTQEKSTTFKWIDAEGDYTGFSFDTNIHGAGAARGVTNNNTFIWLTDSSDDEVYIFLMDGTFTGNTFDTAATGLSNPFGITNNNTFIWIVDFTDNEVYKFNMDGTYAGFSFDTEAAGSDAPVGATNNNTFIWVTDTTDDEVYKFWMNGTYTGDSFDTNASGNTGPFGITTNNEFIWVTDSTESEVFKYTMDGTYTGTSFDTAGSGNAAPFGITNNITFFYVVDSSDDEVYQYELFIATNDTVPPTWSDNQTNNTEINESTIFSLLVDDNKALEQNGTYIFSTNNTGTWVNDSAINFTTTPSWANVTKILNDTNNTLVGYRWYLIDNEENVNNTVIFTLTTTFTPPPIDPARVLQYWRNKVTGKNVAILNESGGFWTNGTIHTSNFIKIDIIILPACNSTSSGIIGRNSTKLYFCDGSVWNGLY